MGRSGTGEVVFELATTRSQTTRQVLYFILKHAVPCLS